MTYGSESECAIPNTPQRPTYICVWCVYVLCVSVHTLQHAKRVDQMTEIFQQRYRGQEKRL